MKILVTGSGGLIGGEAVEYFGSRGHEIVGVDNNMRKKFFGDSADILWNLHRVVHKVIRYAHHEADIQDMNALQNYVLQGAPYDAVIHCAAQPSHDYAEKNPEIDYGVNVQGTKNLLECTLKHSPNAVFIFMSTNKVYDNAVNSMEFEEFQTRFDKRAWRGFDETTSIGANNTFGRHKLEADLTVQIYAAKGLKTVVLRGGCLTGPGHSGVEMHGFLSHLIKTAATDGVYKIFGYEGKQVRDNIHSYDVMRAVEEIIKNPIAGEIYNIGGGRGNSISILEAIAKVEGIIGKPVKREYVNVPRSGDHKCYITDFSKLKKHYPNWGITKNLDYIFDDILRQIYWGQYSDHEDTKNYPLNENSVVIDVGGYRGAFTDDIVKRYNCFVHVIEPIEDFYHACVFRFKNNPKVTLHNIGLSHKNGNRTIASQGQNSSLFRGGQNQPELPPDPVYGKPVPIIANVVDAAEFFERNIIEADLISLNAEGAEFEILPRLIETGYIQKCRNVQIQFHKFYPNAEILREAIRTELRKTHVESFNYPWVWESWKLK